MSEHRPTDTETTPENRSDVEPPQVDFRGARDWSVGHDHPHFGLIYETQEELFATAIPFLREGLERGDRCWYITDDTTEAEATEGLSAAGIDVETAREAGDLAIHSSEETYFEDGEFDPEALIDRARKASDHTEDERLRIVSEATWQLEPGTDDLVDGALTYESRLDDLFAEENCLGLCMYNRERFPPETLEDIIEHHPQVVYDGTVTQNWYYAPSNEDDGSEHSEQAVSRQLETLIERAKAKDALERREQQLNHQNDRLKNRLLETSPTGILVFDAGGEITLANDRAEEILGMESEELVGRSYTTFEFLKPNGESMPVEEMPVKRVWQSGDAVFDMEVEATRPDGRRMWLSMNGAPLYGDTDDVSETIFTLEDITERKRREERQEFLFEFSDALRAQPDEQSIKDQAVEMLAEHLNLDRCWISEVFEQQGVSTVGPEHIRPDLQPMSGVFSLSEYPETMRQLATQRMVIQDAANDPRFSDAEKEQLAGFDLRALLVVPLRKGERDVIWALAATMTTPRQWTDGERALLEDVAERTWAAVERARAEEELRESEERQRLALEAGEMGVWELDLQTNDSPERTPRHDAIFGYEEPREDWSFETFLEHVHPDDREQVKENFEQAYETGVWEFECRIIRADEQRWITAQGEFYDDEGEPVRAVGTVEDITERKERERRLERQRKQIAELKDRLLETSPTGILVVDETGEITLANDRATEIVGMSREQLVGLAHGAPELGVVDSNGDPMPDGQMPFEQVSAAGEAVFGIELGATRNDGERVWLSVNVAPLYSAADAPTEVAVACEDITERKQANEALAHLNDASRELMDADRAEIIDRAAKITQEVVNVEYASLWRYDDEAGDLQLQTASTTPKIESAEIRYPEGFEERAWQVFVSNEMDAGNDLPPAPDIAASEEPIRSNGIVPLGRHGIIYAGSIRPDEFDERTTDLAETVAANVETALDRAEDEQQLEAQNTELTQLNRLNDIIREIDAVLVQADTREDIERVVCERLSDSDLYEFAWVGATEPGAERIEPLEWDGIDPGSLDRTMTDETDGLVGTTLQTRETQIIEDIVTDARSASWREQALERGVRSCISVPLHYEESLYGVLTVYANRPQSNRRECEVLEELGETIAHAINAAETRQALGGGSVIEVGLELRDPDTPLSRLAERASCDIEFEGLVRQSDDSSNVFFIVHGASMDEIHAVADESTAIQELICLSEGENEHLCKARITGPTLASVILAQNATIRSLSISNGVVIANVDLSQTADVREFVESIQTKFPDVELTSRQIRESPMQTREGFRAAFEERLTDRQQEVLRTAYLSGFFKSPRETTGQELAALFDVSQSTFAQHLRAGQHNHFEVLFDET